MRRIPLVLMVVLFATLVIAGCGEYGQRYEGEDSASASADTEERLTDVDFDEASRKKDGCGELQEQENQGRGHTTDPDQEVDYDTNPPTSGEHYQVASEWGLYDTPQPDVMTVHNLEHGHLVISYKGLSDKQEEELRDQVRVNPYHLLLQPRPKNPKDGVYYSAWTKQVHCERPSEVALQYMIDTWRDQGPELFTDDPSRGMGGGDN